MDKLPEKWCIKITLENRQILKDFIKLEDCGWFNGQWLYFTSVNSDSYTDEENWAWNINNLPKFYTNYKGCSSNFTFPIITLDDFKEHVLGEKKYTIAEIETNDVLFVHCENEEQWKKLKQACKRGRSTDNFFKPEYYNFSRGVFNPMDYRTKIKFNQVIFEEFILPEKWYCLYRNREEFDIANDFFKGNWLFLHPKEGSGFCNCSETNHWWSGSSKAHYKEYVEITFQQFEQYVLKSKKMEQKEIIGYKLKKQFEHCREAALKLSNTVANWENVAAVYDINKAQLGYIENLQLAGVLDLWFEPVYKKEEEFNVGDWVYAERQPTDDYRHEKGNKYIPVFKIEEIYESNFGGTWLRPEVRCTSGISSKYCRKATPEEIKAAQTPQIVVNGYKGEFFDEYVKFGCANIAKIQFQLAYDLVLCNSSYSNKQVESVTIGKGTFTKEQIKAIAEYYLNKK